MTDTRMESSKISGSEAWITMLIDSIHWHPAPILFDGKELVAGDEDGEGGWPVLYGRHFADDMIRFGSHRRVSRGWLGEYLVGLAVHHPEVLMNHVRAISKRFGLACPDSTTLTAQVRLQETNLVQRAELVSTASEYGELITAAYFDGMVTLKSGPERGDDVESRVEVTDGHLVFTSGLGWGRQGVENRMTRKESVAHFGRNWTRYDSITRTPSSLHLPDELLSFALDRAGVDTVNEYVQRVREGGDSPPKGAIPLDPGV